MVELKNPIIKYGGATYDDYSYDFTSEIVDYDYESNSEKLIKTAVDGTIIVIDQSDDTNKKKRFKATIFIINPSTTAEIHLRNLMKEDFCTLRLYSNSSDNEFVCAITDSTSFTNKVRQDLYQTFRIDLVSRNFVEIDTPTVLTGLEGD